MSVKIKEIVLRYEDDGHDSKLSPEEYKKKYAPLSLVIHHHCAPPAPPAKKQIEVRGDERKADEEVVIDVSQE